MLSDKWFDDGKGLSATRSADHPCSSETVADVHPALAELAFVVVSHRDVHAVLVLHQFFALLEALVLEVETVFHQPVLDVFRDVVQGDMHEHYADKRGQHVQDDVHGQRVEPHLHRMIEQPDREYKQRQPAHDRQQYLPLGVELQMFLVTRAETSDADKQHRGGLAVYQMPIVVYHPPLDAAVYVRHDAAPVTEQGRVDGVGEELHQYRHIHHRPEYPVESL